MIRSYAIVLAVTTLVTAALVPLMVRLAGRLGAIAIPNDRKVHATPTPTLGGGAMFIGMLAGIGVASTLGQFDTMFESRENIIGVVVGAFVIFMTGVIDDIREVSAPAKVAAPFYIKRVDNDDKFITAVDPKWSGALPFSILYDRSGKRVRTFTGEVDLKALEASIRKLL